MLPELPDAGMEHALALLEKKFSILNLKTFTCRFGIM